LPIPSKGGTTKPTNNAPLPNFRGKMKQMDDKTVTLETDDHRDLQFKRNAKTKFFKNGDEVKSPKFTVGDQLSVEASEDPGGYFTAVNVYWEKGARAGGTETASDSKGSSGLMFGRTMPSRVLHLRRLRSPLSPLPRLPRK
jgi:hypothetical protein